MLIINRLSKSNHGLAVALGTFDGLHRGHTELIRRTCRDAETEGLESTVLTFAQHPLSVLDPKGAPPCLASPEMKRRLYAQMGVRQLAEIPFTRDVAELQPGEFVYQYLLSADVKLVEVGFNFRFGFHGLGDAEYLEYAGRQLGFGVHVLEQVRLEGETVSSSLIRSCVQRGDFDRAKKLLGRPYTLTGTTRDGVFSPDADFCLPPQGQYDCGLADGHGNCRGQVEIRDGVLLVRGTLAEPNQLIFSGFGEEKE